MKPPQIVRVQTSDDLDAVFQAFYGRLVTFVLSPGRHFTRGAWAHLNHQGASMTQGAALVGAGSHMTTIALADDAVLDSPARIDLSVLRCGANWGNNGGVHIAGITIDGNQSTWAAKGKLVTNGLRLWANRSTVEDVRVIGLRGSYERGHEAFGISTINEPHGPHQAPDGGTIVRDCVVEGCAENSYVSCFSIGYRPLGRPILRSIVERCRANAGAGNYFAFGACHATTFRDCTSNGTAFGFYNDTDSVDGWLIDGCECLVSYSGIHLVAQGAGAQDKRGVRAVSSKFLYSASDKSQIGVGLIDRTQGAAEFDGIVVDGCTFTQSGSPFALVSTDALSLKTVRVTNSTIPPRAARHVLKARPDSVWHRSNWYQDGTPAPNTLNPLTA